MTNVVRPDDLEQRPRLVMDVWLGKMPRKRTQRILSKTRPDPLQTYSSMSSVLLTERILVLICTQDQVACTLHALVPTKQFHCHFSFQQTHTPKQGFSFFVTGTCSNF